MSDLKTRRVAHTLFTSAKGRKTSVPEYFVNKISSKPEELSDFILPDLNESPTENCRVAITGALMIDQETQTTVPYPVVKRPVLKRTTGRHTVICRPSRINPIAITANDSATTALAKWAKFFSNLEDISVKQKERPARLSVIKKPRKESLQLDLEGGKYASADRNHGNHDANDDSSSGLSSSESTDEQIGPKTLKTKIYDILENPETCLAAQCFSLVSMGLIMLSVGTFIAETMPEFRADLKKPWYTTTTGMFFYVSETFFIAFFTLELVGRFVTCPNKKRFVRNFLNIIDLTSILPFYVELMVPKSVDGEMSADGEGNSSSMTSSLVVLRVLRLFRVLRIFKLGHHSNSMVAFGLALKSSLLDLLSLGLFLVIDIVVFASVLYYCEMKDDGSIAEDDPNNFSSIPASCWWAVATITTVGYGDMYPRTVPGRIFASLCVFSGILVIAFQVPIIVAKFTWTYMQGKHIIDEVTESDEEEELEEEEVEEEVEDGDFREIGKLEKQNTILDSIHRPDK